MTPYGFDSFRMPFFSSAEIDKGMAKVKALVDAGDAVDVACSKVAKDCLLYVMFIKMTLVNEWRRRELSATKPRPAT